MKKFIGVVTYTGLVALASSSATAHYYAFKSNNKSAFDLFSALKATQSPKSTNNVEVEVKTDNLGSVFASVLREVEQMDSILEAKMPKEPQ